MADELLQATTPSAATAPESPVEGLFDLGDTELHFNKPRNPDGTFARIPTTPADQITPPAPTVPKHPDYLTNQAADLGLEESDYAELSTAALGKLVYKLTKQQLAMRQSSAAERDRQGLAVRPDTTQPLPIPPVPPAEEELDLGVDENGAPIKPEDLHPGLLRVLRKQAKEAKELRAELEADRNVRKQEKVKSAADALDGAFAEIGDADLFGEGAGADMQPDDDAFQRRIAVLRKAKIDLSNVNPRTIVKQIKAAMASLKMSSTVTPPPPAADPYAAAMGSKNGNPKPIPVKDWNNGAVAVPTARRGANEPKGDAKAVANLTEKMRDSGMLGGAQTDSEVDDTLFN